MWRVCSRFHFRLADFGLRYAHDVDIDPIQLTRRLVDIESITYNEGAVGEYLADVLGSLKFQVETMPVEAWRFNVYAASCATPDVVLSTHMDTVPPFFGSSEDDEFIYGRGSC